MNGIHPRIWMHPLLIGMIVSLISPSVSAEQSSVTVTLSGLRSQKGNVIVCLWRQQDKGFPMCSNEVSFQQVTVEPTVSVVRVGFPNVPSGEYAISAFHDENNNGKIDRSFIGQPKEGIAFSSLNQKRRGRPSFDKSKFTLNGAKTIFLSFTYF